MPTPRALITWQPVTLTFVLSRISTIAGGKSHNSIDKLARNLVRMCAAALRGYREGVVYYQLECANFFGYWRSRLAHRRR